MKLFNLIKCWLVGHDLEEESIIPFIDKTNWLKKCRRCGRYVAHSDIAGSVTVGKKQAERWREEMAAINMRIYEMFEEAKNDGKEE